VCGDRTWRILGTVAGKGSSISTSNDLRAIAGAVTRAWLVRAIVTEFMLVSESFGFTPTAGNLCVNAFRFLIARLPRARHQLAGAGYRARHGGQLMRNAAGRTAQGVHELRYANHRPGSEASWSQPGMPCRRRPPDKQMKRPMKDFQESKRLRRVSRCWTLRAGSRQGRLGVERL